MSVRSAVLSAFSPTTSTGPPPTTKAYLVVQLAGTTRIDHTIAVGTIPWIFAFTPLTGSRLTFTPAGQSPQAASATPSPQPAFSSYDDGLFDTTYTFVVPASVTSGTLGVVGGTFTGQLCSYQCGPTTGAITLGAAQLPLAFPSLPAALHAQKRAPWIGAPLPSSEASAAAPGSSGAAPGSATGGGGFPLWAAVLIPALLALAVYGVTRARRSRTPALVGAPGAPPAVREHSTQPTREPQTRTHPTPSDDAGNPDEIPTAMPAPSPTATSAASSPQVAPSIPPEGAERSTEVPELGDEGDVVVRVLGPVVVAGWQAPRERRTVLTSLLCFLAINAERPRRTEELLVTAEGSEKTLRNNLSRLRQSVGTERFPDASVAGGYRVVGIATDWGRLCELVAEARTAAGEGEAERADELLAEALRHVRGVPFEGAHPGAFGWALDTGLVHQMTSAIVDAAHRLSEHRLAAGDPVGATVAARLGQRAAPDEFVLWRDLFAVARAQSDPSALARLSAESTGALGTELARALSEGRTPFAA